MKFSKGLRKANSLTLITLSFLILLIALAVTYNPGQLASANGGEPVQFDPKSLWSTDFNDDDGWYNDPSHWATIKFPDVNGDGLDDVCGRGDDYVYCTTSTGTDFPPVTGWEDSYRDGLGWNAHNSYWQTIQFPDINGDGMDDICGRNSLGIMCGISTGSSFLQPTNWSTFFSNANGWISHPSYYETIQFPDLNNDGRADICGRTSDGIYCGISAGELFLNVSLWGDEFSDANGWKSHASYWSTIQFPDINGDDRQDVCGRGVNGIICGKSNGTSFTTQSYLTSEYGDDTGWKNDAAYWATIQFPDINGDGLDDVCGRASGGIFCGIANGNINGYAFEDSIYWDNNFSDANGWQTDRAYYATIRFPDLNGDDTADVCGRGVDGINCAISDGSQFGEATVWQPQFGDSYYWHLSSSYWSTIRFPDVNGDGWADVCGRQSSGITCAPAAIDDTLPPPTPNYKIYLPSILN